MSRIEKLLKAIINNTTYDEPRLSRIEEIFYSILNSLPYNANAQSRIEALLLALKESGLYDERTLSRIEEILKCKLDGRTYTGWIGSRVEMLLNEWELSEIIEATFTSFPIIIKANGEPLIDYTIYGNMSQSGTPTSSDPIQPQETGERTGNLFDPNSTRYHMGKGSNNRIGFVSNGAMFYIEAAPNTNYTIKIHTTDSTFVRLYLSNAPIVESVAESYNVISESETTINPEVTISNTNYTYLWIQAGGTWYAEHGGSSIMLNTGDTALPYEPYGYKLDISSANTTTPVYLGEVETTRRIKKYEFTGQETGWNYSTSGGRARAYIALSDSLGASLCVCSHYDYVASSIFYPDIDKFTLNATGSILIGLDSTIYTDVTAFKSYLAQQYAAGTPVCVWYVLATPTTGIVNEPLRKIGDYADTLSMEQAGVEIPTLNKPNNTIIDVETTLKPSEMYVKYNGEGTRVYITADSKLYITSNNEIYILKR